MLILASTNVCITGFGLKTVNFRRPYLELVNCSGIQDGSSPVHANLGGVAQFGGFKVRLEWFVVFFA